MAIVATAFDARGRAPARATRRSAPVAQEQQADERLRVAATGDRRVQLGERNRLDVDPLALDLVARLVAQAGREEDVALLVGEAGRRVVRGQVLPLIGGL